MHINYIFANINFPFCLFPLLCRNFKFTAALLVYICFCCLFFLHLIKQIIAKVSISKNFPYVFV